MSFFPQVCCHGGHSLLHLLQYHSFLWISSRNIRDFTRGKHFLFMHLFQITVVSQNLNALNRENAKIGKFTSSVFRQKITSKICTFWFGFWTAKQIPTNSNDDYDMNSITNRRLSWWSQFQCNFNLCLMKVHRFCYIFE